MKHELDQDLNSGIYWICTIKDTNFKKNYTQSIKIYDLEIPIYSEYPGFEIENVTSTKENFSIVSEIHFDIISRKRKLFNTTSRGRETKIGQSKIHKKSDKDNVLRKVKVRFLNFVIELANIIVAYFGFKGKFIDLEQNFKINVSKRLFKKLKSYTFEQLLCINNSKTKHGKHSYFRVARRLFRTDSGLQLPEWRLRNFRRIVSRRDKRILCAAYQLDKGVHPDRSSAHVQLQADVF
jgi:hypothetical protein